MLLTMRSENLDNSLVPQNGFNADYRITDKRLCSDYLAGWVRERVK